MSAPVKSVLELADLVLTTRSFTGWQRAAAFLLRQALEAAVDARWSARAPSVLDASRKVQFLALEADVGSDVAQSGHQLWATLSRACHVHVYELAPSASELITWRTDVAALCAQLRAVS